jgi:hypothetical protein
VFSESVLGSFGCVLFLVGISLLFFLFYCHASSGFEDAHKARLCWKSSTISQSKWLGMWGLPLIASHFRKRDVVEVPVIFRAHRSTISMPKAALTNSTKAWAEPVGGSTFHGRIESVHVIFAGVDEWLVECLGIT